MASPSEISLMCRLCLMKDQKQVNVSIFEDRSDNKLLIKISALLPITISKEDQLPKKICNGCSDKLNLLYAFRNTALESEQTFLSWFKDDNLTINALAETIVKEEVEVDEESLYLDLVKYSPSNEMSENSSICQDRTLTSSPIFDDGPDSTTSETFTYRIVNFYSDDDLEDQTSGLDQSATIGKPINKTQDEALAASPILPNHDLENQAKTIFPGSSSEKFLLQDDVIHGSSVSFHHIALNLSPTQETLGLESKHGGNNEKTNVSESDTITNLKNMERDCRYSLLPLQEKLVLPIFLGSSSYISDSESKNNNHQKTFSGFNSDTFVVSNEFAKGPFDYEDSGSEYLPSSDDESTSDFHMSFEEDLEVPKVQNTYPGKKTKLFKSKGKGQLDLPNAEHIMKSDDNQPSTSSKVSEELTSESDLECQKFNQCYKNDDRPFFEPAIEENQKYTRKPSARERPTICPICYHDVVTHFTRHLFRHHGDHKDVEAIKSLNPRSKERLSMVTALRKQGYFHLNVEKNVINPVRSSKLPNTEYFACPYCLGHYSKKLLHKHVKICRKKPENIISPGKHCLSKSQSVVASIMSKNNDFLRKSRIHKEVFNFMRADDISAVAKSDPLICLYGEALISKHKTSFISNKMREMARMLIVIRTIKTNVIGLFDILQPEMFQTLLDAVKTISGYDPDLKEFKAPSLALHMGTNLKTICDIAFKLVIEGRKIPNINWTDKMKKKAQIKDLKKLLEGHWCNELSSVALKNLRERQ